MKKIPAIRRARPKSGAPTVRVYVFEEERASGEPVFRTRLLRETSNPEVLFGDTDGYHREGRHYPREEVAETIDAALDRWADNLRGELKDARATLAIHEARVAQIEAHSAAVRAKYAIAAVRAKYAIRAAKLRPKEG